MRETLAPALPSILLIIFTLMLQGATPLITPTATLPHMAALMVLFWSLYRPQALPCWIVLLVGLMLDVLHGQPLGLEASMLLLLRVIVEWRLRIWAERPFPAQWLLIGVLLAAGFILKGWVQELYLGTGISWSRTGMAWFLSVLCYPIVHMLCSWVFLTLPRQPGSHTPQRHEGRR